MTRGVGVGELFNSQNDGPTLPVLMTWDVMYTGDPFLGTDTCLNIDTKANMDTHWYTHFAHTLVHTHTLACTLHTQLASQIISKIYVFPPINSTLQTNVDVCPTHQGVQLCCGLKKITNYFPCFF